MKAFFCVLTLLVSWQLSAAEIQAPYIMPAVITGTKLMLPQPLWEGLTQKKIVALTFDDGPSAITPKLLDVLKQEKISATFFVLGTRLSLYPDTLRRMQREGHLVALHGAEHVNLHGKNEQWLIQNIKTEKKALTQILGKKNLPPRWFFRPPFGALSPRIVRVIQSTGTRVVMCSILPGQQGLIPASWKEEPTVTTARVLRDISPGGVIALHDGEDRGLMDQVYTMTKAPETALQVIRALKKEGYQFVRIDQLKDPAQVSAHP